MIDPFKEIKEEKKRLKKEALQEREFYDIRSILGNANWATFYILLGGRQAGKSYSVTKFYVKEFFKDDTPFYWLRLTDTQARKLLQNNADKLVDPDIKRKYNLDLVTNAESVYHVTKRSKPDKNGKTKILEKKLMARVLPISTFYSDKGNGYFDNEYDGWYNIAVDEFQREANEKNTFDIMYALVNQLENLVRNRKKKIRIFFLGNTLQEASDVLCAFNFIPEEYGRYKIKKKRAVIDYIEPSEAYKKMRAGSIADILMPEASTFTNKIDTDYSLVYRGRLRAPSYIIKFDKTKDTWFTVWDGNIIAPYNKEIKSVIAMSPYIDEIFVVKTRDEIIQRFDYRAFKYRNLITFKQFQKQIQLIKPRK